MKKQLLLACFLLMGLPLRAQPIDSLNRQIVASLPPGVSIVGLGDPSHQESSITACRIDLIKKLVKEKGFRIIAIEGNLLELYEAHRHFLQSNDYAAYERAMYSMLNAAEMEALYDFVYQENQAGNRLLLLGFDVAFSGSTFVEIVQKRLERDPIFSPREKQRFCRHLRKIANTSFTALFRNAPKQRREIKPYLEKLLQGWEARQESDSVFLQAMRNLDYFVSEEAQRAGGQARDLAMGRNIEFLKRCFGGEKIILFGSSTHLLKRPQSLQSNDPFWATRISLGEELRKAYGPEYYFIAYTAISGAKYNAFGKPTPLPAPAPGSIEAAVGQAQGAVYRTAQTGPESAMDCRFLGHRFLHVALWDVFDGLVLMEDIAPFRIKK